MAAAALVVDDDDDDDDDGIAVGKWPYKPLPAVSGGRRLCRRGSGCAWKRERACARVISDREGRP